MSKRGCTSRNVFDEVKKNLASDDFSKFDSELLKEFKSFVKEWLKGIGKSHKWLALNIKKSSGSVKNWLYTPLNITPDNVRAIVQVVETYGRGGDLLSLAPKSKTLGWLPVDLEYIEKIKPDYMAWCSVADIPFSCFNDRYNVEDFGKNISPQDEVGYIDEPTAIKLADWVTSTVNEFAANILRPVYIENKENSFEALKDYMENMGNTLASPEWNRKVGGSRAYDLCVHEDTESEVPPFYHVMLYLPVIMERWQGMLVDLAVAVQSKANNEVVDASSSRKWIISTLNEAAKKQFVSNLEEFVN